MIHHFAIKTQDPEKLAYFYSDILGLKLVQRHLDQQGSLRSIWFETDGTLLMLEKTELSTKTQEVLVAGFYLLAFPMSPEKRGEWKKRLEEKGVVITSETSYSIYFSDTDGNRLALSHYPQVFLS